MNYLSFYLIFTLGVVLDQMTKYLAENFLTRPIVLIDSLLSLQLVHNTGAAFGILNQYPLLLLAVNILFLLGVTVFFKKIVTNTFTYFGVLFMLIGAVGNLIDRLVYQYVIDFISLSIIPVFNIADICINIGAGFFLLDFFLTSKNHNA